MVNAQIVIDVLFWGVPGLIVLISLLVGLKKGLTLSLVNLVRIVVTILLAMLLTKLIIARAQDTVLETAVTYIEGNDGIRQIMDASPELARYVTVLALYLIAPIVFLPVFFVTSIVMLIPTGIVKLVIKSANKRRQREEGGEYDASGHKRKYRYKKTAPLSSLWGMLIGVVCGVIVSAALLMPFSNYAVKADEYFEKIQATGYIESSETSDMVVDGLQTSSGHTSVKILNTVSAPLFDVLTTYTTTDNKKASVFDDLGFVADIIPDVIEFTDGLKANGTSDFTKIDLKPMKNVVQKLKNTGELKNVVVSVLAKVGKEWGDGGELFGINMSKTIPEDIFPSAKIAFDRLASMSEAENASVALDVVNEFVDAFGVLGDIYAEVTALSDNDFSDISSVSVKPISNVARILSSDESALVREIAARLISDAGTKWSEGKSFLDINIKSSVPEDFDSALNSVLGVLKNTTADKIAGDLVTFADTFDTFADVYGEIDALSKTDFNDISSVSVAPLDNIADILRDSKSDLARDVVAGLLNTAGESWKEAQDFMSINIKNQLPSGCDDCFDRAFDLLAGTSADTVSADIRTFASAISAFGKVYTEVDALSDTEFDKLESVTVAPVKNTARILSEEGNDLARGIVADLISSASAKWLDGEEFMGLNLKESLPDGYKNSLDGALGRLKNSTELTIVDELNYFADAIEAIKGAYKTAQSITQEDTTIEEMQQNMTETLNSLTPESVGLVIDVISDGISDTISDEMGNENNASVMNDAIADVLTDIAELPEEDRAAEAAALVNIITYVSDSSAATAEPDALVESVVASSIISDEINKLAEDERTFEVDSTEYEAINTAIDDYINNDNNDISEEQQKLLESLRSLFVVPAE